jgi:hypothetical protein
MVLNWKAWRLCTLALFLCLSLSAQQFLIPLGSGASDTVWNTWSSTAKCTNCLVYNGGLSATAPASFGLGTSVLGKSSGKWWYEVRIDTTSSFEIVGIINRQATGSDQGSASFQLGLPNASVGFRGTAYCIRRNLGGGTATVGGGCTSQSAGQWIGVALDLDAGTINFYVNGTLQAGAALTGIPAGTWYAVYGGGSGRQAVTANFGQNTWTYPPPSGFFGWYQ